MIALRTFLALSAALLVAVNAPSGNGSSPAEDKSARCDNFNTVPTDFPGYIWPTDASTRVTSAFAEYRSTHFHGGIDISTNGVTGYKVFAVSDGYLYRIWISDNGYGKMLFVKHRDGYISSYAHLSSFSPAIHAIMREEQYRTGKYCIDLALDPKRLPVRKGDVIAYTGDTGFGPPHLHFELRDSSLNPVNPLYGQDFPITDKVPPTIRRVMISPLDYRSTVENQYAPKFLSRFPRRHTHGIIPQTIRLHGQIGIAVEAADKSDGSWSRAGIHRMQFYLDDSLTFSMELNRIPVNDTKLIDLHYDLGAISRGWGHFQKLYVDTGNSLPFYGGKPPGTGVINTEKMTEGEHGYRIVCSDIKGNSTELTGTLFANHTPSITIQAVTGRSVRISTNNPGELGRCYVYGKRAFQPTWVQHTIPAGRFEQKGETIELPVNTTPYDVIKVVAENTAGSQSQPQLAFINKPHGPARAVHIGTEYFNDHVRLTVSTPGVFTATPLLTVREGPTERPVELVAQDVSKYTGAYVPSEAPAGQRSLHVDAEVNGKPASADDEISIYTVPANHAGAFPLEGSLSVAFDSGATFRPLYIRVSSDQSRHSTVYTLEPQDVLLNRGIRVSLPAPDDAGPHWGMYFRSNGGWVFETGRMDSLSRTFSTTLARTLGDLALFEDDQPPSIGRLRVQPRKGKLFLSFRYFDNLSGISPDDIQLRLDDRMIIPEIDGEHHRAWYLGEEPLAKGRHTLLVTVRDRANNETQVSRTFLVRS
jgi:hypothetical protein